MGVKGLWQLLLPIGRRISIESLEGKILAIDASIWLTQFLKAMRDPETGRVQNAAHLIGFIRRLCRLRFHGIRPVLVFDGATPEIKKRETAKRRARREQFAKLDDKGMQKMAKRLLAQTLQQQQKVKKSAAPAMAPGFNPGGGQDISHPEEDSKPAARESSNVNETENDEAIAISLAAEEYPSPNESTAVSDWDAPADDAVQETDGAPDNEKEWDFDKTEMTIDHIASLPPSKRKDAIELAKRQQRKRSRREFMPAAGNPADFSNVQIANFLRSTNLNKSIHDMGVKEVARKEENGEGLQNNSNIILIRESEDTKEKPEFSVARRQEWKSEAMSSEDEEREDYAKPAWYAGERRFAKSHLRAETFSSSSSSENGSEDEDLSGTPKSTRATARPNSEKLTVPEIPHTQEVTTKPVPKPHISDTGDDNSPTISIDISSEQNAKDEKDGLAEEVITSEDDVQWEDGAAESQDASRGSSSVEMSGSPMELLPESLLAESGTGEENSASKEDNFVVEDTFSKETNEALARAEGTALNLADWAGRAFRRAIREVKPASPLNKAPTKTNEIGTDEKETAEVVTHVVETKTLLNNTDDSVSSPYFATKKRPEDSSAVAGEKATSVSKETEELIDSFNQEWRNERNQRERDMDTISDEMKLEVMQLLQMFGVPYVEAPTEAEAQCAMLEELGLVDGIVTEDSDVFVFGGQTVYKNIFADKMYAEAYVSKDAEREMGLNRNSMVALAMLLGSDYTEGVKGVGVVNAMEVLQSFDVTVDLKEGMTKFREWLDGFDPFDTGVDAAGEDSHIREFHLRHKTARNRWIVPESFPADNVIHAFLSPVVDTSTQRFSWGIPDVDELTKFCARYVGWSSKETKDLLSPVIDKITNANRFRQTRIDAFMTYEDSIKFADVRSKRLRSVLGIGKDGKGKKKQKQGYNDGVEA